MADKKIDCDKARKILKESIKDSVSCLEIFTRKFKSKSPNVPHELASLATKLWSAVDALLYINTMCSKADILSECPDDCYIDGNKDLFKSKIKEAVRLQRLIFIECLKL